MRDSYVRFFSENYISKDQFFEFGLRETIYSPYDEAEKEWSNLKFNIKNNKKVFIRGFGRDANGTKLYQEFYKILVGNENITKDSTNNNEPTKLITNLTGYSKIKKSNHEVIRNYQVSHVFGRTKNIYAFTAPWNIVYMPKMLDPLTGHEAKGEMIDEYTILFQKQAYATFPKLIDDFNEIVTNTVFRNNLEGSLLQLRNSNVFSKQEIDKLEKSVYSEFSAIELG